MVTMRVTITKNMRIIPPTTFFLLPPVTNVLSISLNTKSAFTFHNERMIAMTIKRIRVHTIQVNITIVAV